MKRQHNVHNLFSVDIEDWFHILDVDSAPDIGMWDKTTSLLEKNTDKTLRILSDNNIKATFFVLGWVAEKYPGLVKKINEENHEIASHGYAHKLIYEQTEKHFFDDIKKAKDLLESITGKKVKGYRAPGFSITEKTPWAFEKIAEAGYEFDSSIFPIRRSHGGMIIDNLAPHIIDTKNGSFFEFPISVYNLFGKAFCLFGGGYLRLAPACLIKYTTKKINSCGRPVIYYIHPREIDSDHPRIKMNRVRYFKCYVNVGVKTEKKIISLFKESDFITFSEYINKYKEEKNE